MESLLPKLLKCFALVLSLAHLGAADLYEGDPYVRTLEEWSSFNKEVFKSHGMWMVVFYAPLCPESEAMVREYKRVAEVSRGIFNIGAVDMSTDEGQRIAAKNKVDSYPTILVYGDEKKRPKLYEGERKAQNMFNHILELTVKTLEKRAGPPDSSQNFHPGGLESKVVILKKKNFKKAILNPEKAAAVVFAAPDCAHSKKLRPEFEEAARQVENEGGILGWVDATVETELAKEYGVESYPTIFIFPAKAKKSHSDASKYHGGRLAIDIARSIYAEVDKAGLVRKIPEMTSGAILEDGCGEEGRICIIAALPHISETGAERRNKYLDTLVAVSRSFRGSDVNFLWFEGGAQPELERDFGMTFGFPAVAALEMEKESSIIMRGPFSENAITKFAERNENWRKRSMTRMAQIPNVLKTTPWDGKDVDIPVEDEIPLSEIMDEL